MPKQATPEAVDVETREARLAQVVKDLAEAREAWEALGRPLLMRAANLDIRPHPFVKIIRDLEQMAERMARPLEAAIGGRPQGAQSAPDRQATAPARLQAVS